MVSYYISLNRKPLQPWILVDETIESLRCLNYRVRLFAIRVESADNNQIHNFDKN